MGHCPCHTNWDCGRRVGAFVGLATFCAACGALCPNSWSDPRGYVTDGHGKTFCDLHCERTYVNRDGESAFTADQRRAAECG